MPSYPPPFPCTHSTMRRTCFFDLPISPLLLSLLFLLSSILVPTFAQPCLTNSSSLLNVSSNTFGRLTPTTGIELSGQNILQLTNLTVPTTLRNQGGVIESIAINADSNSGGTGSLRLAVYRQIAGVLTLVTSTAEVTIGGGTPMSVFNVPCVPAFLPPNPGPVLAAVWFSNGALGMYTDSSQTGSVGTVTVNYSYTSTGAFPVTVTNGLNPIGLLQFNLQMQYTVAVGCNLSALSSSTAAPAAVVSPLSSSAPAVLGSSSSAASTSAVSPPPSCLTNDSALLNVSSNTFGRLTPTTGIELAGQDLLQLTNLTVPPSLNSRGGVIESIAMNVDSNSGGTGSFRLAVYRQIAGVLTLVTSTAEVTIGGGTPMSVVNVPCVPAYVPPNPGPILAGVWFNNGALGMYTDSAQTGSLGTVTVNYSYSSTGAFPVTVTNGIDPTGLLEFNLQMQYTVAVGCTLSAPLLSSAAPTSVISASSSALSAVLSSAVASSSVPSSSTVPSSTASSAVSSAVSSSVSSSAVTSARLLTSAPLSTSVTATSPNLPPTSLPSVTSASSPTLESSSTASVSSSTGALPSGVSLSAAPRAASSAIASVLMAVLAMWGVAVLLLE